MDTEDLVSITNYSKIVRLYHGESDRAAAILAGSFAESFLEKFLKACMIDDLVVEELFQGYSPLSTFSARIACGYAFGSIGPGIKNDLTYIRKVRNHFAHHPAETSFEVSPVRELCANLSSAKPTQDQDGKDWTVKDARSQYLLAVSMTVAILHNAMVAKNKISESDGKNAQQGNQPTRKLAADCRR